MQICGALYSYFFAELGYRFFASAIAKFFVFCPGNHVVRHAKDHVIYSITLISSRTFGVLVCIISMCYYWREQVHRQSAIRKFERLKCSGLCGSFDLCTFRTESYPTTSRVRQLTESVLRVVQSCTVQR